MRQVRAGRRARLDRARSAECRRVPPPALPGVVAAPSAAATSPSAAGVIDRLVTPEPDEHARRARGRRPPRRRRRPACPRAPPAAAVSSTSRSSAGCHGSWSAARSPSIRSAASVYCARSLVPMLANAATPQDRRPPSARRPGTSTITPACSQPVRGHARDERLAPRRRVATIGAITHTSAPASCAARLIAAQLVVEQPAGRHERPQAPDAEGGVRLVGRRRGTAAACRRRRRACGPRPACRASARAPRGTAATCSSTVGASCRSRKQNSVRNRPTPSAFAAAAASGARPGRRRSPAAPRAARRRCARGRRRPAAWHRRGGRPARGRRRSGSTVTRAGAAVDEHGGAVGQLGDAVHRRPPPGCPGSGPGSRCGRSGRPPRSRARARRPGRAWPCRPARGRARPARTGSTEVGHPGRGDAAEPGDDPVADVEHVARALAQVAAEPAQHLRHLARGVPDAPAPAGRPCTRTRSTAATSRAGSAAIRAVASRTATASPCACAARACNSAPTCAIAADTRTASASRAAAGSSSPSAGAAGGSPICSAGPSATTGADPDAGEHVAGLSALCESRAASSSRTASAPSPVGASVTSSPWPTFRVSTDRMLAAGTAGPSPLRIVTCQPRAPKRPW